MSSLPRGYEGDMNINRGTVARSTVAVCRPKRSVRQKLGLIRGCGIVFPSATILTVMLLEEVMKTTITLEKFLTVPYSTS